MVKTLVKLFMGLVNTPTPANAPAQIRELERLLVPPVMPYRHSHTEVIVQTVLAELIEQLKTGSVDPATFWENVHTECRTRRLAYWNNQKK
ncbi:hypothetical protein [Spirosoma sordidisoli]|uniref:Uncharacterized protein n=1 Tax=Spirosoma sordidisoli TaxID=2502893 RepID=A0A4Q2USJ5_9BACT|nr:hypothetical protein [Spirosoma sordidisoli]RYC70690.1 hypothetical protein EQG79_00630 [Spirosoma sordidisoli]